MLDNAVKLPIPSRTFAEMMEARQRRVPVFPGRMNSKNIFYSGWKGDTL